MPCRSRVSPNRLSSSNLVLRKIHQNQRPILSQAGERECLGARFEMFVRKDRELKYRTAHVVSCTAKILGSEILFFEKGTKALESISDVSANVVPSDLRIPEMHGAEFLSRVTEITPGSIRPLERLDKFDLMLHWFDAPHSTQVSSLSHVYFLHLSGGMFERTRSNVATANNGVARKSRPFGRQHCCTTSKSRPGCGDSHTDRICRS